MDVQVDFEPMSPGFESRASHDFFFFFFDFFYVFFLSLLLQCKFANLILLSLLSFSYFNTPYDAQASSAFSALIFYLPRHFQWREHITAVRTYISTSRPVKIGFVRYLLRYERIGFMFHAQVFNYKM